MKKLLCIALTLMMIAAAVVTIPVSASEMEGDDVLVVTVNGENPTQVKVGNQFLVFIGLYAGEDKILDGQVHMEYDSAKVEFVPHEATAVIDDEEVSGIEFYSFPPKIRNASIVYNYTASGVFNYNFTKANGVAAINDASKLFARFRFKATAAGTTDISHLIQYMVNENEERIFYKGVPSETVNPYMAVTIDPSSGCIGDADGDYDVTIMDATFIQRYAAGVDLAYNAEFADVTGDNALTLKDAVVIRKYLAGAATGANVGDHVFATES